jgi:hypothetical protein
MRKVLDWALEIQSKFGKRDSAMKIFESEKKKEWVLSGYDRVSGGKYLHSSTHVSPA